ncbi:DUF2326 domain-containing protein [Lysinibacillus sp. CD3-6]|uniref:DUF2326 domain-containing protein n=1 Tax=Lysinibacillus sp. CD3-6 TaxID=2892541 RepID=UPI0011758888|nr:DUF2326 domain-containing protein [Lysinibacillus sp. CD3-6]UED78406.1 DUF2326 domain-containing protein [Lysinibacillus sp. CD3-6]
MIHQINSDFPNFKEINLTSGVNIILAENKINTTNSLGKSLFLESINFIMGADYSKSILSKHKDLDGYSIKAIIDLDAQKKEYCREISKDNNKFIRDSYSIIPWTNDEWKKKLLMSLFNRKGDSNIITWRNLFHFFYQNNTSVKFEVALRSYKNDPEYKTSLFQSFLLNLATDAVEEHSQTKQITSEKKNFNKYLNTLKKSLEIIPEIVPKIENISTSNKKIIEDIAKLKNEISQLEKKINLINLKNKKLSTTLNELRTKTNVDSYEDFKSFFRIIEIELGDYIKKTFKEAKTFHDSLVSENIEVIENEISQNNVSLANLQGSLRLKYKELNNYVKTHNLNNEKFDDFKIDDIILNNLIQNGGQAITSIVDSNIKDIAKIKNEEIPQIISNNKKNINNYRRFLTTFVNLVYKSNKNVEFNIKYNTKLDIIFKYDDDNGTGKGNMKIIIYYIFILLFNNICLQRKIDFLILDTDITDGIDSNNLFALLKITDRLFKKHGLQIILTLRNDRNLDWNYINNKKWIKHRLSDTDEGYLFKPNLK